MEDVDAVVIGAGVIGLAVARELALSGRAPLLLEAAEHFGTATSARSPPSSKRGDVGAMVRCSPTYRAAPTAIRLPSTIAETPRPELSTTLVGTGSGSPNAFAASTTLRASM